MTESSQAQVKRIKKNCCTSGFFFHPVLLSTFTPPLLHYSLFLCPGLAKKLHFPLLRMCLCLYYIWSIVNLSSSSGCLRKGKRRLWLRRLYVLRCTSVVDSPKTVRIKQNNMLMFQLWCKWCQSMDIERTLANANVCVCVLHEWIDSCLCGSDHTQRALLCELFVYMCGWIQISEDVTIEGYIDREP